MRATSLSLTTAACLLLLAGPGRVQENAKTIPEVKYEGLKNEVLKQRGKVLLVDFWNYP